MPSGEALQTCSSPLRQQESSPVLRQSWSRYQLTNFVYHTHWHWAGVLGSLLSHLMLFNPCYSQLDPGDLEAQIPRLSPPLSLRLFRRAALCGQVQSGAVGQAGQAQGRAGGDEDARQDPHGHPLAAGDAHPLHGCGPATCQQPFATMFLARRHCLPVVHIL